MRGARKVNSKRNLMSNLEDMDSDDDERPIFNGGPLTSTFKRSQKVVSDNSALLHSLMAGRQFIGEYHAQLSLDNISLNDLLKVRQGQHNALLEKEERLDTQLNFIFEDCKRLSKDNEAIVAEGKRRDVELAELYVQLDLEESKFRSTKKNMALEQEKHTASNQAKWKQKGYLMKAKEKLVRQHENLWVMQDVVEYLQVEVAHLEKQLEAAQAKKSKPLTQQELAQAAAEEIKKQQFADSCKRKDCVEFRASVQTLNLKLQELVLEQRRLNAEARKNRSSSAQLEGSALDNSFVRSFNPLSQDEGQATEPQLMSPSSRSFSVLDGLLKGNNQAPVSALSTLGTSSLVSEGDGSKGLGGSKRMGRASNSGSVSHGRSHQPSMMTGDSSSSLIFASPSAKAGPSKRKLPTSSSHF